MALVYRIPFRLLRLSGAAADTIPPTVAMKAVTLPRCQRKCCPYSENDDDVENCGSFSAHAMVSVVFSSSVDMGDLLLVSGSPHY